MRATTRYICEVCEKEFICEADARRCEDSHENSDPKNFSVVEITDRTPKEFSSNKYPKTVRVYKKGAERGVTGGVIYAYVGPH